MRGPVKNHGAINVSSKNITRKDAMRKFSVLYRPLTNCCICLVNEIVPD
jgi:hypothetical protein